MNHPLPTTHPMNQAPAANNARSAGVVWVIVQTLLLAALIFVAPCWSGHWPLALSMGAGIASLLYAAWTGLLGVRDLGRNRTPLPAPQADAELVTTGIYARLRHPLNASMMAMGLGWACLWSSGPALGIAMALAWFLHAKSRHEEQLLLQKFADYARYASLVPRYFSRLSGPKSPRSFP